MLTRILLIALLATLAGCTNYNFKITKPQDQQRLITDAPQRIQTANMGYQMQAYEGRLVVLVRNERYQAIELLGNKSFVVDPKGASHPLRTVTIAPQSYVKLILPPLRPRFENAPQWNIGVSGGIGSASPAPVSPLYLDVYEDTDAFYWDWDGTRPIRLSITYRFPDGKEATDEFTIDKIKA